MRRSGQPSWLSMPLCGRSPRGQGPGYSSLTRPTSGRTRSCGGSGCSRENLPPVFTGAGSGGVHQSQLRGEGQLLLSGMLGDGGGGMDGTGWQQQLGHLGCLPEATEREVSWALEGDLGQCASPSWGGDAGIPADTESETATGEPPFSRGQVLPGYSPDFNADEAIWGWAREEATGNLCLGSREAAQERVGRFLAGLTHRKEEVRRRCRTILQSRAEAILSDFRPDSQLPANAHPTLALV